MELQRCSAVLLLRLKRVPIDPETAIQEIRTGRRSTPISMGRLCLVSRASGLIRTPLYFRLPGHGGTWDEGLIEGPGWPAWTSRYSKTFPCRREARFNFGRSASM